MRRSRGRSFISCTKPCPSSLPSRLSAGNFTSSKNNSEVSAESRPSFLSFRPRRKPVASSVSTTISDTPFAPAFASVLATTIIKLACWPLVMKVFRAVEHIPVAGLFRRGAHALQVRAGAGLAHGDGADKFAGNELWQPATFLFVGPVMENVGRDDTGVQRRPERIESRKTQFPADHCFVRKTAAGPAVLFGHGRTKEASRA